MIRLLNRRSPAGSVRRAGSFACGGPRSEQRADEAGRRPLARCQALGRVLAPPPGMDARPVVGGRQPAVALAPVQHRRDDQFSRPGSVDRTGVASRRGTTPARCPCGSFSDAALPNPAGPFPITGLSSDYVVIVVGCSITEDIEDRFGALHYAYLAALRCPVTCAPSPCGRLSRPPWWVVAPTTTMGTPSPWGSRPEG